MQTFMVKVCSADHRKSRFDAFDKQKIRDPSALEQIAL